MDAERRRADFWHKIGVFGVPTPPKWLMSDFCQKTRKKRKKTQIFHFFFIFFSLFYHSYNIVLFDELHVSFTTTSSQSIITLNTSCSCIAGPQIPLGRSCVRAPCFGGPWTRFSQAQALGPVNEAFYNDLMHSSMLLWSLWTLLFVV